jgi:hypothetical protein
VREDAGQLAKSSKEMLHQVFRLFFVPAAFAPVDLEANVHHPAAAPDANVFAAQFPFTIDHAVFMRCLSATALSLI